MCPLRSREPGAAAAVQTWTEREDRLGREPQEPEGPAGSALGSQGPALGSCRASLTTASPRSLAMPEGALRTPHHRETKTRCLEPRPPGQQGLRPGGQRGPLGLLGALHHGGTHTKALGRSPWAVAPLQAPGWASCPEGRPSSRGLC